MWPSIVRSDLVWAARGGGGGGGGGSGGGSGGGGGGPEAAALDSAQHVLFSVSGRALGEGAPVLLVGPELSDAELRGRGNRALVFAA